MLKELHLKKVGPADEMRLQLKSRLNLITGDNGLGKSFLLDIAWWAMTKHWPRSLNKSLVSGYVARPNSPKEGSIAFKVVGKTQKEISYTSKFSASDEAWVGKAGRPHNPGLVLYAMADGGFAVWDPARNYWKKIGSHDVQERVPAYVFSPREVWDGLKDPDRGQLCNGLISDWAGWQKENGKAFEQLSSVLEKLSETENQPLKPGPLIRISLDDARDIPTLQTAYGKSVPVLHASSGVRRIIALAYLLVWSWQEHVKAAELLGEDTAPQLVFLVDEVEAHLHPRWQRQIVPALLDVTQALAKEAKVQLVVATHSPLVMLSAEPHFDASKDAWWDMDLEQGKVVLCERAFEKYGDADRWLTSEAFDLRSSRSLEYEQLLMEAAALLDMEGPDAQKIQTMNTRLLESLSPTDDFLFNWRYVIKAKGWLK